MRVCKWNEMERIGCNKVGGGGFCKGLTDCQIKLKGAPTQFARGQFSSNFVDNLCHSTNEVDMPNPCWTLSLEVAFSMRIQLCWPCQMGHFHITHLDDCRTLNMPESTPLNYLIEIQANEMGTKSTPDSDSRFSIRISQGCALHMIISCRLVPFQFALWHCRSVSNANWKIIIEWPRPTTFWLPEAFCCRPKLILRQGRCKLFPFDGRRKGKLDGNGKLELKPMPCDSGLALFWHASGYTVLAQLLILLLRPPRWLLLLLLLPKVAC